MNSPLVIQSECNFEAFHFSVDLILPGSGITAVIGPSGSGKTTLLRCLAGLQKSSRGYIKIRDALWEQTHTGVFVPPHKRSVGYVLQSLGLFPHLTVRENIEYGFRRRKDVNRVSNLHALIELMHIEHLLERKPGLLSGGEQQRVAIVRAVAQHPDLLLMDEPLSSIDDKLKMEIIPYIQRLKILLNIPILYVTHSFREVELLADTLLILQDGSVKMAGHLKELLQRKEFFSEIGSAPYVVWEGACIKENEAIFGSIPLRIDCKDYAIGENIRIKIESQDVFISLERNEDISVENICQAEIEEIQLINQETNLIVMRIDGKKIFSLVTRMFINSLQLKPGIKVFACFTKSTKLM